MFRITSFQRVRPFGLRGKKRPIPAPVSPAPSKIPYGGFSPVRLQASCQRRPSLARPTLTLPQWLSPSCVFDSVRGLASKRHTRILTPHTRPVALGSATGCSVRQPPRLLWPHPRLWNSATAYDLPPQRSQAPELPQFTLPVLWSVPPSILRWFRRFHSTIYPSPMLLSSFVEGFSNHLVQPVRPGWVFHEAATFALCYGPVHCSPCPARTFTSELSPSASPPNSVGYNYVGNSQFPRLVFHQQDRQPYGLRLQKNTLQPRPSACSLPPFHQKPLNLETAVDRGRDAQKLEVRCRAREHIRKVICD